MSKSAIVIGAGIVGLATALALGRRGYKVTVLERSGKAVGASIRNFGMIWPIGQPEGILLERALRSRAVWKEVCDEAGLWFNPSGSMHLVYTDLEAQVLEEFYEAARGTRDCTLLSAEEAGAKSSAIVTNGLRACLYSADEMVVNPRMAIDSLPSYLTERYGIKFIWNRTVTEIAYPFVWCAMEEYSADEIYVCTGADFETLYPALYASQPITKCKLQMMRMASQPDNWQLGPSLCGGLSLAHYKSFAVAASLPALTEYFQQSFTEYVKWGIHVMVSQNGEGELTVGDSHEYGNTVEPFDKSVINALILDYLKGFARFPNETVMETWNGIYPKMTNGATEFVVHPEPGVTIINALSGAGMTLSFGLCEDVIANLASQRSVVHAG
jgi:FAD dependent oxidoreductase TIGR03364